MPPTARSNREIAGDPRAGATTAPVPRTSLTHPLRIDALPAAAGRIGLTFCPGKCQAKAMTGAWARDLDVDLDAVASWGADALVTLLEEHEFEELAVPRERLAAGAAARGIDWVHLPIRDEGVPDEAFERRWAEVGPWLRDLLRRGRAVVLHCKGGLGRTGTIAARLLVELGEEPESAIARVRAARHQSIETREQEEHVRRARRVAVPEYPDRVAGCLLAGAVGDALGAGVELLRLPEIRSRFGDDGVRGYVTAYGRRGAITDDTQMTLFTVEGLIRASVRGRETGITHPASVVWNAYRRWLRTQGASARQLAGGGEAEPPGSGADGWLVADSRLHERRGPGTTCLSALASGRMGTALEPINDSKGCGGVMRAAPAGLLGLPVGRSFELGADIAAVTHGNPTGYLAAGCLAAMVAALVEGATCGGAVDAARLELSRHRDGGEVESALAAAVALAADGTPSPEAIERLGAGWVADEALAIAVCCALAGEPGGELEPALLLAVNHSGDSDSTGAITGNLLGARWGREAVLDDLLVELELRDVVEALAEDLVREVVGVAPPIDLWWERYPGS